MMKSPFDEPITSFRGEYSFLSNMYPCEIEMLGNVYPSVENAYQAFKTTDLDERIPFTSMTPKESKRAGRKLSIRNDWDNIKIYMMSIFLFKKFQHDDLKELLMSTGNRELIEGNYWKDRFWGECPVGNGKNHLGKLLMRLREDIKNGI